MSVSCICNDYSKNTSDNHEKKDGRILSLFVQHLHVRIVSDYSSVLWLFVEETKVKKYKFKINVSSLTLTSKIVDEKKQFSIFVGLENGDVFSVGLPNANIIMKLLKNNETVEMNDPVLLCRLKEETTNVLCVNDCLIVSTRTSKSKQTNIYLLDVDHVEQNVLNNRYEVVKIAEDVQCMAVLAVEQEEKELCTSLDNFLKIPQKLYEMLFGYENFYLNAPIILLISEIKVSFVSMKSFCRGSGKTSILCDLSQPCEAIGLATFSLDFIQENSQSCNNNFTEFSYKVLLIFEREFGYTALIPNNTKMVKMKLSYNSAVHSKFAEFKGNITLSQAYSFCKSCDTELEVFSPFNGETKLHSKLENEIWVFNQGNIMRCLKFETMQCDDGISKDKVDYPKIIADLELIYEQEQSFNNTSKHLDSYICHVAALNDYLQENSFDEFIFGSYERNKKLIQIKSFLECFDCTNVELKCEFSNTENSNFLHNFTFVVLVNIYVTDRCQMKTESFKFDVLNASPQSMSIKLPFSKALSYDVTYSFHISCVNSVDGCNRELNVTFPILTHKLGIINSFANFKSQLISSSKYSYFVDIVFSVKFFSILDQERILWAHFYTYLFNLPNDHSFEIAASTCSVCNQTIEIEFITKRSICVKCNNKEVLFNIVNDFLSKLSNISLGEDATNLIEKCIKFSQSNSLKKFERENRYEISV